MDQALEGFLIFFAGFCDYLWRQIWCWWGSIPVQRFEVVPHKLLIVAYRARAGFVQVRGPEPGRIGSQAFIDQQQGIVPNSEFTLCVGNDDTVPGCMHASIAVQGKTQVANDDCSFFSQNVAAFLPADVLVMSGGGFCCGRKNWLWKLRRLFQTGRQFDSTDGACFLVFFPPRTRQVAADHAFDGERFGFANNHRTIAQQFLVGLELFRKFSKIRGDEMVANVVEFLEPEGRNCVEDRTLARDGIRQDAVERRYAVCGDEEQVLSKIKDFADLATAQLLDPGQVNRGHFFHDETSFRSSSVRRSISGRAFAGDSKRMSGTSQYSILSAQSGNCPRIMAKCSFRSRAIRRPE